MNKKVLIVITIVLAIILVGIVATIIVLGNREPQPAEQTVTTLDTAADTQGEVAPDTTTDANILPESDAPQVDDEIPQPSQQGQQDDQPGAEPTKPVEQKPTEEPTQAETEEPTTEAPTRPNIPDPSIPDMTPLG